MRSHPSPIAPPVLPPETHPVRSARRTRSRKGTGRRRARPPVVPHPEPTLSIVDDSTALYRAEKARRANSVDAALMAEAKRLYDEAVAESGAKRAGMRSAVVPPSQRKSAREVA